MNAFGRPRRWQLVIGGLMALLLLLAAGFVFKVRQAEREAVRAAAVSNLPIRLPGQQSTAPLAAADAADPVELVAGNHGADQVEVCGGTWVSPDADGLIDWAAATTDTSQAAMRERVVASMQSSPDPFARASAVVEGKLFVDADHYSATVFGGRDCNEPVCRFSDTAAADVAQARDQLAQMAVSTSDPRLYALALDICGFAKPGSEGNCRMLNPAQWARLEPGNAAPWLMVLDNAVMAGDRAGVDEALHQVAAATFSDRHSKAVTGALIAALPDNEASLPDTTLLALRSLTTSIAYRSSMNASSIASACKGDALHDANRAQTCDRVAELLVGHADDGLHYLLGLGIGQQIGWPQQRIDGLRGQYVAWAKSEASKPVQLGSGNGSCASLHSSIDGFAGLARFDEGGSMREWLAASGKKPADFVEAQQLLERERRARQAARTVAVADRTRSSLDDPPGNSPTR